MDLQQLLNTRRATKQFQEGVPMSDDELRALMEPVKLTPSSFNIQHWHFIAVRDDANKQDLMACANGQAHVGQCSAAIIVVADPTQYKHAGGYWRKSQVPDEVADRMEKIIPGFYEGKEQKSRDEALRSCGMAAMTLMLRATDLGWASCPMIGFDAEKVAERFAIKSPRFPAMLVVVGKPTADAPQKPRPYRRPVSDIVYLEAGNGRSL